MTNNYSKTECHSQDDAANNYVSSVKKYNHDFNFQLLIICNYQPFQEIYSTGQIIFVSLRQARKLEFFSYYVHMYKLHINSY